MVHFFKSKSVVFASKLGTFSSEDAGLQVLGEAQACVVLQRRPPRASSDRFSVQRRFQAWIKLLKEFCVTPGWCSVFFRFQYDEDMKIIIAKGRF